MTSRPRLKVSVILVSTIAWSCASTPVSEKPADGQAADSGSQTPFIDRIRSEMRAEESMHEAGGSPTPFLDARRKAMAEEDLVEGKDVHGASGASATPYIDQLKRENPALSEPKQSEEYISKLRSQIGDAPEGGAIAALHEGRSELHAKYAGEPSAAFGFRYGISVSRNISGDSAAVSQSFDRIYGSRYAPELTLFYNWQLLRAEGIGSLGLAASIGIGSFQGNGNFEFNLAKPDGSGNFSSESQTKFQFFELPLVVGAGARLSVLKYLQPYAIVGPAIVGYAEMRNDKVAGHRGFSQGLQMTGGAAILLDWIMPSQRWDAYSTNAIHHTYLTVEYTLLTPLAGDVSFNTSGLTAGITFEY